MNCKGIHEPKTLVALFRSDRQTTVERTIKCFYCEFFENFKYAFSSIISMIGITRKFTSLQQEELTWNAFNDGLLSFFQKVRENGYEEKAAVKTVFFEFYKRKLWGLAKALDRELRRKYEGEPDALFERVGEAIDYEALKNEAERIEREYALFCKGCSLLDKRCANLLRWRKLDKLKPEEIGRLSGIKESNINNEVYRCWLRLQNIIDELRDNL